jgi:hypothetical protein
LIETYPEQVAMAVKEMQKGKMPQADFWIAGWHFNSALVRIIASYESTGCTQARTTP